MRCPLGIPLAAWLAAASALGGCVETRVVGPVRGGLHGLGQPVTMQGDKDVHTRLLDLAGAEQLGEPVEGNPLRREAEDGKVHLLAPAPRHLLSHIWTALEDKDVELIEREILSEALKDHLMAEGQSPRWAAQRMVERRDDIFELLMAFPGGETTPGTSYRIVGQKHILTASLIEAEAMRYGRIEMILEGSTFRLLAIK